MPPHTAHRSRIIITIINNYYYYYCYCYYHYYHTHTHTQAT